MRVESLSVKVDDLVPYIIVACNDETSVAVSERVTHRKGLNTAVAFLLKFRGVNFITST